jgi:hypothetical protein
MRVARSRSAVALASLAYLLATALGGLLHRHEHGRPHNGAAACHHASETQSHQPAPPYGDDESPVPISDDDCLACRLAAQSGLVAVPLAEPGLCPFVVELPCAAPTIFVEPELTCGLARAPPVV